MAPFAKTIDQVKTAFGQMAFSQKMLIVTLLVIVVGSTVWLLGYAGRPDMAPVIDQAFEPAVQARMSAALKAAGIQSQVRDGKVLVARAETEQARAALAMNEALAGQDFSFGFEQVVKDSSIWRSEAEKERMWKVAVENELAAVLKRFPGVQDAKVIIDRPERQTFGRSGDGQGSASVHLRMKPGASIDKKLTVAAVDWVSGAVRNLPRERVKVIDSTSGRSYQAPGQDASVPADLLELAKQHEEHLAGGVMKAIGHIDNVLVSVSVKLSSASRRETAVAIDKDKSATLVVEENSVKSTSGDGAAGGEPGVAANTGAAVPAAAAGGSRRSESEDRTVSEARFGERRTETAEPAGSIKEVSATVNIPRSYFLTAFKAETGQDAADPAALKEFMATETAEIKTKVLAAIGLGRGDEGRVAVGWYYDTATAAAEPATTQQAGTLALLSSHARPISLGALAVVCLVAMLLMLRKAAGAIVTIAPTSPSAASAGQILATIGDVMGGETPLGESLGVELDEESLRTQKMVDQVAGMAKEDPDAAAGLIRRWIARKPK